MDKHSFFTSFTVMAHGPIDSKSVLKGLFLRFLESELHLPVSETLFAAARETTVAKIIEIKGTSDTLQHIELPQGMETFCLIYQFMGTSRTTASGKQQLKSGQHAGYHTDADDKLICQIDRGKTWMLLVYLSGPNLRPLHTELSLLRQPPATPLPIGYRQKHLFDKIQRLKTDTFMLGIKLDYYIALLLEQYRTDLSEHLKTRTNADIALYHKAVTYILEHCTERKLTRQQIADELCVSVRTLTRAFGQKKMTTSRAILLGRLHKAREWLRADKEVSIDHVASELHFAATVRFVQDYTALFKKTPEADRKKGR